jgi:hypothetical protein
LTTTSMMTTPFRNTANLAWGLAQFKIAPMLWFC